MRRIAISFAAGAILGLVLFAAVRGGKDEGGRIDTSRAAVIQQVRTLGRLETASFTVEKVIEAGTEGSALKEFLFGDRLLLIARGEVIAGVDLAALGEEDVAVEDGRLTLRLPAPVILTAALSSGETRVYDRSSGIFSRPDKDLETEARAAAEASIRAAACDSGILDLAAVNARKQLTVLFMAAGFADVTIDIPQGRCA